MFATTNFYTYQIELDTNRYDLSHLNHIAIPSPAAKAYQRFPPQPARAANTSPETAYVLGCHTGPVGNITSVLQQGRFLPSTLHFQHNGGVFAQGFRATETFPRDHEENARIILNTWNHAKNSHSIIVTFLAWGTGKKITRLQQQRGAVFHQNGRCWVIDPKNAIVCGLAWSADAIAEWLCCEPGWWMPAGFGWEVAVETDVEQASPGVEVVVGMDMAKDIACC
eukprot:s314_g1.t1